MKNTNLFGIHYRLAFILLLGVVILATCKKTKTTDNTYDNTITPSPTEGYGLVPTPSSVYNNIPVAPTPVGASGSLPSSFSLDIPSVPFNQGNQASCACCASAMAKSIMDHLAYKTSYINNSIIYSPTYIYFQTSQNPGFCSAETDIASDLEVMKNKGICLITDMPYSDQICGGTPTSSQDQLASQHKISNYYTIPINTATIKQHISQGQPVIVCFEVDDIFNTKYWNPNNKNIVWSQFGNSIKQNHTTILYGWDDSKNAFRMLNQWGASWGDNGSIWVDYNLIENANVFWGALVIQNPTTSNTGGTLQVSGDLNFGTVAINSNATKTIQIKNSGLSTVNVSNITIGQPYSVDWTSGSIQPSSSQTVNVTFKSTSTGSFNQNLTITSDANNNPVTIAATATVNQQQTKIIALSGTLSFGNVNVGQSSSLPFTITNQGNTTLNVSSISLPTGFSGSYSGQIQPGSSSSPIQITFSPSNATQYSGQLTVNSDATSGTNTISLNGIGVSANNSPTVIPAINTYAGCVIPKGLNPFCNTFTDGEITAEVTAVNPTNHTITFQVEKCNGTVFNSGGTVYVVSGLCLSNPVTYASQSFSGGNLTFTVTATDNNMVGSRSYYLYIFQNVDGTPYFFDAPPININY